MSSFLSAPVVEVGAAVGSADEFAFPLGAGEAVLSLGHGRCAGGVFPLEESHQKSKRIRKPEG